MEILEAKRKFERLNRLTKEHGQLKALVRAMERHKKEGIDWDVIYMDNVCKRILDIEKLFDEILK